MTCNPGCIIRDHVPLYSLLMHVQMWPYWYFVWFSLTFTAHYDSSLESRFFIYFACNMPISDRIINILVDI